MNLICHDLAKYLCSTITLHMALNPLQSVRVLLFSHTLIYLFDTIIQ